MKLSKGEIGTAELTYAGNEDNEIVIGDFVLGTCGAFTSGVPTLEEFSKMLSFLVWISRNQPWWIGDLITWGEQRFGDDFYNEADLDPWAVDQIERHAAVARAMPPEVRNKKLWFTHHREVCRLPREQAVAFLQKAEEQVLSSSDLRGQIPKKRKKKAKW